MPVRYQTVSSAEEDFGGQIPAQFTAEAALDRDGLEREILQVSWHVAATTLAGDHEGLTIRRSLKHARMIGEYKANSLGFIIPSFFRDFKIPIPQNLYLLRF
jgi:hypothetical protein